MKLLIQAVCALYFLGTCDVLHADLLDENIFVHHKHAQSGQPDFYIADFGMAQRGPLTDPCSGGKMLSGFVWNWKKWSPITAEKDVLWKYLDGAVHPILLNSANMPINHLPDLVPLLDALQQALEGPSPPSVGSGFVSQDPFIPLYNDSEQDALNAAGVADPWHLAQVSIDIWTTHVTILPVSAESYDNAPIRGSGS